MFKLLFLSGLGNHIAIELSYSKISAYNFCPWKYKLLYEDGFRTPPTPQISLGQTIHRTLEKYHQEKKLTMDAMLETYDEQWVNDGFTNAQQTVHYYEKGQKMLEQYFEFSQNRKSEIVKIEQEFKVPIGKRILRGIVDRIDRLPDGTYEVIDYKTHAEMWDTARIDNDLQLTLYSIGCKRGFDIQPSVLSYFFLAHSALVSTHRSVEQEEKALADLEIVAQKIEQKNFVADTKNCYRCDFKMTCKYSAVKKNETKN